MPKLKVELLENKPFKIQEIKKVDTSKISLELRRKVEWTK